MLTCLFATENKTNKLKSLILYFSGTGNTEKICKLIERSISDITEAKVFSIEETKPSDLPEHDVLIIAFPVYALDCPVILRDYIHSLPEVRDRWVYVVCTHAGAPGNAVRRVYKSLARKGYKLLGFFEIPMIDPLMVFLLRKGSTVARIVEKFYSFHLSKVEGKIDRLKDSIFKISRPTTGPYRVRLPLRIFSSILRVALGWLYEVGRKRMWKYFWVDEKCVSCGLCLSICPLGNIYYSEGKIMFGNNCMMCLRCLHKCPSEAIQVGKITIGKCRFRNSTLG